jgi:hypothetical protein
VAPTTSCERSQCPAFTGVSKTSSQQPRSVDEVERFHCHLEEIITIATVQLMECARWHQTRDSTSSPDCTKADWRKVVAEPSVVGTTPSPA